MKTAGIICEYNPFHLGHARQIRLLREKLGPDSRLVCIMSGNYVQRGMPAMWDKYTRAQIAVSCGADLVLELPVTSVLQSAEGFARGGVEILHRLSCVDTLCFGVEATQPEMLLKLAERMALPSYQDRLRDGIRQGLPYAAARQLAAEDETGLLSSPNNILGLEYLLAIQKLHADLTPLILNRTGDYHAQTADLQAPSATAIRALFPSGDWETYMPEQAAALLDGKPWYDVSYGERAMLAVLRRMSQKEWMACAHGSEGLWSKVMKAVQSQDSLEKILTVSKSKRYPRTRIQRLLLCAYLGISEEQLYSPISDVRVLAATTAGCNILRTAKKHGSLSLFNAGERPSKEDLDHLERRAADLFTLFAAPGFPVSAGTEQHSRIFIQKA